MFRLTHNNSLPAKLYELSLTEEEKTFYLSNSCLCDQNSPVVKTFNTLTAFPFPLFCGTKFLHHRLRLRKTFFKGETDSPMGQLLIPHVLYKVHSLFSA